MTGVAVIDSFIAAPQILIVENVTLQPDFGRERGADLERSAGERAGMHEHFQFQGADVHVDPIELAAGERIAQWLEGDHPAAKNPIVFMRGARGYGPLE